MAIDFSKRMPWSGIKSVTIDGNDCVWIPKFYYRVHTPTSGAYAGRKIWSVSDNKADGFTLHPAFIHNNVEQDGFYFGAYEAYNNSSKAGSAAGRWPWVNIDFGNAKNACTANGSLWHLQNIYERHAIALLMLIELGTSDVQSAIGIGGRTSMGGTTNAVWRGIHEFWGSVWEWVDGFYTANGAIHVFDNTGTGTYVTIKKNISISSDNGFAKVLEDKGSNYDLNSLFIPSDASSTSQFPDLVYVNTSGEYYLFASGDSDNALCGAFSFNCSTGASDTFRGTGGFRAARYVS